MVSAECVRREEQTTLHVFLTFWDYGPGRGAAIRLRKDFVPSRSSGQGWLDRNFSISTSWLKLDASFYLFCMYSITEAGQPLVQVALCEIA